MVTQSSGGIGIASPTGVLITLPAMVAVLGLVMTVLGARALRTEREASARDLLVTQAAGVSHEAEIALAQANPIMSRLHEVSADDDPSKPLARVSTALHDLVLAHAGITYVSESFPDGTFRGAFVDKGSVYIQETHVAPNARMQRYVIGGGGELALVYNEPTEYDPRVRPFYVLATHTGSRTWSDPYTFYDNAVTGVTCTEPVIDDHGTLHSVLTVDFDVDGLSAMLGNSKYEGGRTLIFSEDGSILAFKSLGKSAPPPKGRALLRAEDLEDPAIVDLVSNVRTVVGDVRYQMIGTGDSLELAAVSAIASPKNAARSPSWYVAALAPERSVIGPLRTLERRALLANLVAVAIAIGIAVFLARRIVAIRQDLAKAKASLEQATELGSYRLVERLGAGGQGEVWRGEHRLLARDAAIKLIRPDRAQSDSLRERFRREAQALASMKSRNTIELFDYGVSEDGIFFYVMELLDGVDLESLVREYGPQPAARVIAILIQACSSLAEAHERGLLHRDVKPANVFLCRVADELDVVKVLDFGLVNPANEPSSSSLKSIPKIDVPDLSPKDEDEKLTATGVILGTPGYMAPEQATGAAMDARADIYALGCVAWWLLSGEMVYDVGNPRQLLLAHISRPIPSLSDIVVGWLPKELEALVVRCLAKSPDDRPQSARAIADELRAIAIGADNAWDDTTKQKWWARRKAPKRGEVAAKPVLLRR